MTARYAHLRDETLKEASSVAGRLMQDTAAGKAVKEQKTGT
jgi:hypothetical protein